VRDRAYWALTKALMPLMRATAVAVGRVGIAVPRPADAPRGRAPGPNPYRVLLLGCGPAVGWGVRSHDLALPGALARAIAGDTGRGCTVDLVADPGMHITTACRLLAGMVLHKYDGVVVMLGVDDALRLTRVASWRRALTQLLAALRAASLPHAEFFLVGIQPITSISLYDSARGRIAERHARALNVATRTLAEGAPRTTFIPLSAALAEDSSTDRHRSPLQYAAWASSMAAYISGRLHTVPKRPSAPLTADDERIRQRAVDRLNLAACNSDPVLTDIVHRARQGLGSAMALLTVIDHDQQRNIAATEPVPAAAPRIQSFCAFTIRGGDALIVRDTLRDARFRTNPAVTTAPQIRFYAGFPVESPTGERIGALCVVDTRPQSGDESFDTAYLRELALEAERRLWCLATDEADRLVHNNH
jgi:hypothetical protein